MRAQAEAAVDAAGLVATALEQELERRHVPAALAPVHHARAQCRPAAATERVPRLGAGDAVDEQPAVLLERSRTPRAVKGPFTPSTATG